MKITNAKIPVVTEVDGVILSLTKFEANALAAMLRQFHRLADAPASGYIKDWIDAAGRIRDALGGGDAIVSGPYEKLFT